MVGQYPHGIDMHVRNLKWALRPDDHAYVITLPEIIRDFNLVDGDGVTYLPFVHEGGGDFINFWAAFPSILKNLKISPEWFLFMEEDIFFHRKPEFLPKDVMEIANYLPLQTHYHAIMVNDKRVHHRVWEGATMVHAGVVNRAIEYGINFSFAAPFFYQKDEAKWEQKMGGKISLRYFAIPDTFDEFGLYCALVENTKMCYFDRAVHLRGPESLHRKYPNLYATCTEADLEEPIKKLPYLDVYAALAPYYIDGHWKGDVDWKKMEKKYQDEFVKLLGTAREWMRPEEYTRLVEITGRFSAPTSS